MLAVRQNKFNNTEEKSKSEKFQEKIVKSQNCVL